MRMVIIPSTDGHTFCINLDYARVVQKGGYHRIEFELAEDTIDRLVSENPDTEMWGDELDLVFANNEYPHFQEHASHIVATDTVNDVFDWEYWCQMDSGGNVMEKW